MQNQKDDFRKQTGQRGEHRAVLFLLSAGYEIVERNWRCRLGEIDIIAKQGETLVFIEVRTKRSSHFGSAEDSVTHKKLQRMQKLAMTYMHFTKTPAHIPFRIDVLAISLNQDSAKINHYQSAC